MQSDNNAPAPRMNQQDALLANQNRIRLAKSELPLDVVGLLFVLFTRQSGKNPERGCFPTTTSLSKRFGNSRSRFYEALRKLESLGMVRVESGVGRRHNTYYITPFHQWPESTVELLNRSGDNVPKDKKKRQPGDGESA